MALVGPPSPERGRLVECGVGIEKFNDIREGDTLEAFVMEEVKD